MTKFLWKILKPAAKFTYKTLKNVLFTIFWVLLITICLVMGFQKKEWTGAAALFGIALMIYAIRYLAVKIRVIKKQNPPPGGWK